MAWTTGAILKKAANITYPHPGRHLEGDDWIDANPLWTGQGSSRQRHRLHFVSADGRNDWTAELELSVRRA